MRILWQRLRRVLAVEPGEGSIVAWSAAALFLVESASVAVSNVSDTLFLKRVGVDYLPIVFLANSLLLTATTFVAGRLALRFDARRFLTATFFVLAGLLFVLWLLVVREVSGIATTLVIVSKQIDVIALLLFWTVVASLLTSRQSKRLVALMTGGGTLGTIAGSFASGPLGSFFGIPSLLGFAAFVFAAAAFVTFPLGRSAPRRLYRGSRLAVPEQPPQLREFWRTSSLFRVLVATSFMAGVLGPMLYFEFSRAADLATQTADGEQRLLALYGQLRGWINVGVLVVQVGISAALFKLIGVPAAAALAPVAYVAGFIGLGVRFGLGTAMPATMSTSVIDHTVYEPAVRILGNLLPQRFRVAATSVVQGPAKRFGAAIGSLAVLGVVALGDPDAVALVAIPIAGTWMGLSLLLWRNYPNFILEAASVRRDEFEEEASIGALLNPATLRMLRHNLEEGDESLCAAACELFSEAPPSLALGALVRSMPRARPDNRLHIIDAIDRVLGHTGGEAAADWSLAASVLGTLNGPAELRPAERARLIQVLGRTFVGRKPPPDVAACLERASEDQFEMVAMVARIARMRASSGSAPSEPFRDEITRAFSSGDLAVSSLAVTELRYELMRGAGDAEMRALCLALLTDHLRETAADPEATDVAAVGSLLAALRTEALAVLADVARDEPEAARSSLPIVLALADDREPSVRSAALRFFGKAGYAEFAGLLASRLSSRSPLEVAAARAALEQLGPRAADALLHALRHGGRRSRELIPGMLRDMEADPAVLRDVIDREIKMSRELTVLMGVLEAHEQSKLVLQRLRERVDESMHCVLEMLAAVIDDERIANVCRSLGRGWNLRDRAVLLEALEALLPAAESARILPLLEDHSTQRLAVVAADDLGREWPSLEKALTQLLSSPDSLTVALVAATTDSRLLAAVAPGLDVDAALRIFSPAHPSGPQADAESTRSTFMLSPVEKMLHLRSLDLFEGLTTRQLSELARVVREVTVEAGETIVTEGRFEDSMYFIVSGTVSIHKGGQPLAEIGPRDFFGEMSVFDGATRSATATASGEVRLLCLTRNDLFEVMEDQPAIGIGICQTLVRRIRNLLEERAQAWAERN